MLFRNFEFSSAKRNSITFFIDFYFLREIFLVIFEPALAVFKHFEKLTQSKMAEKNSGCILWKLLAIPVLYNVIYVPKKKYF